MLEIRETTLADLKNIQRLWADGEVMRFVGFPEGLQESDEDLRAWIEHLSAVRPRVNHWSVYEDGVYCGETKYSIDEQTRSASLDVKLFASARGRGIATKALALYRRLGFTQKEMPEHVIAQGEDPETNLYFELHRN